jgi:hypothetical protein
MEIVNFTWHQNYTRLSVTRTLRELKYIVISERIEKLNYVHPIVSGKLLKFEITPSALKLLVQSNSNIHHTTQQIMNNNEIMP